MRDCAVVSTFANACVALATSEAEKAWGYSQMSKTAKAAQTDAIDRCVRGGGKSCVIANSFCSPSGDAKTIEDWGALAMSPSTMVFGAAWHYGRRDDADRNALADCAKSGARDCQVVSPARGRCTALAMAAAPGRAYAVGGPASTLRIAANDALARCGRAGGHDCALTASTCPAAGRVRSAFVP